MSRVTPVHATAEIVSVGMVTPVGSCTAQTAASLRAGIARLAESYVIDQFGEPLVMGILDEDDLPPLCDELADAEVTPHRRRLLRISSPALQEALAQRRDPVPLFLGVPDLPASSAEWIDADLFSQLALQADVSLDVARSRILRAGRAAGLLALAQAVDILQRSTVPCILIGGIDSYLDLERLAALDHAGRLKNGEIQDGFVPGEAAAFVLVGRPGFGAQAGVTPVAHVVGIGVGREPGHAGSDAPYLGEGLAQAFTALFETVPPELRVSTLYAGLNGEHVWAKELGVAQIRNQHRFLEPLRIEHPADSFGDTGAAMGPVMLGLAARALQNGQRSGCALIYCSSDREERVAVLLAP